ncbi:RNA polymerase sigma factor [Singulisphaera sp. PoT]|uniref:RNA polymerase sigma factor n=1 Tax=Singulisphaera sp. PoT TaxID=3411797 RepID=UPI003BF565E1
MTMTRSAAYLRGIERIFGAGTDAGVGDAQLLDRFVAHRDPSAFEVLVNRHGPLVLAVCRGVLGDRGDVDDAFQATFLVLVTRAHRLSVRKSLGSWLYRVALRIALHARADARRRRLLEQRAGELRRAEPESLGELECARDLRAILFEEVDRLPERYRAPVVLCHFRGLSLGEAALSLGCPSGTVSGRLTRARQMLRSRLIRRGVTLGAALPASALAEASAIVPCRLEATTIGLALEIASETSARSGIVPASVAFLMKGATKSMILTQAKLVGAAVMVLAFVCIGAVEGRRVALSAAPPEAASADKTSDPSEQGAMVVDRASASGWAGGKHTVKVDAVKHCVYLPRVGFKPGNRPRDGAVRLDLERGKFYKVEVSGEAFMSHHLGNNADPFPGVVLYYGEDAEDGYAARQKILAPGQSVTFRTPWVIEPKDEVFLLAFFLSDWTREDHRGGYTLTITEAEGGRFDPIPILRQRR